MPQLFRKYKTTDMWHQVLINHNGKYAKTESLLAIFDSILTHEFYPCYYQSGDKRDSFFIRNCFEQMECLYLEKLKIRMPFSNDSVTLTYKMNVAPFKKGQIDPVERIQKAIDLSFNLTDKCLNLERFSSKPELNHIELILAVPRMMSNILLKGARAYLTNIENLILRDNGIDSARGMHPMTWMTTLKSIDLSKNKVTLRSTQTKKNFKLFFFTKQIEKLSDIEKFPKVGVITSIKLHDNPLCVKYKSSPLEYIIAVKKIFPDIQSLDGRILSPDGCCVPQKNYLCSIDTYDLTEQFVRHYFTVYDSVTRAALIGLYSKNAIFSMSSNFSGLTSKTTDSRIQIYQKKSRNVLRMSPILLTNNIFYGPENIKQLWKLLPQSQHDFQSFSIDVTYCSVSESVDVSITVLNNILIFAADDCCSESERTVQGARIYAKRGWTNVWI